MDEFIIIIGRLGEGGMGQVWKAIDASLERVVALEVHRDPRGPYDSPYSAKQSQILNEARALAQLSHPNAVPVFGIGTLPIGMYIAMESIEGRSLIGVGRIPTPSPNLDFGLALQTRLEGIQVRPPMVIGIHDFRLEFGHAPGRFFWGHRIG